MACVVFLTWTRHLPLPYMTIPWLSQVNYSERVKKILESHSSLHGCGCDTLRALAVPPQRTMEVHQVQAHGGSTPPLFKWPGAFCGVQGAQGDDIRAGIFSCLMISNHFLRKKKKGILVASFYPTLQTQIMWVSQARLIHMNNLCKIISSWYQ